MIEDEFKSAVRKMCMHIFKRPKGGSYISQEDAAPFVIALPEFWREPARVMASCGWYASADEWMKEHGGNQCG